MTSDSSFSISYQSLFISANCSHMSSSSIHFLLTAAYSNKWSGRGQCQVHTCHSHTHRGNPEPVSPKRCWNAGRKLENLEEADAASTDREAKGGTFLHHTVSTNAASTPAPQNYRGITVYLIKRVFPVVIRFFAVSHKTFFFIYFCRCQMLLLHILSEAAAQQTGLCSYERYSNLCNTPRAELDANKTDFFCFSASSKGCSRTEAKEECTAFAQRCV